MVEAEVEVLLLPTSVVASVLALAGNPESNKFFRTLPKTAVSDGDGIGDNVDDDGAHCECVLQLHPMKLLGLSFAPCSADEEDPTSGTVCHGRATHRRFAWIIPVCSSFLSNFS